MEECKQFCEAFLDPSRRSKATTELALLGERAIPILEKIVTAQCVNQFRVPYIQLGMPKDCSLVTIRKLIMQNVEIGSVLDTYLSQQVAAGHPYAIEALQHS